MNDNKSLRACRVYDILFPNNDGEYWLVATFDEDEEECTFKACAAQPEMNPLANEYYEDPNFYFCLSDCSLNSGGMFFKFANSEKKEKACFLMLEEENEDFFEESKGLFYPWQSLWEQFEDCLIDDTEENDY